MSILISVSLSSWWMTYVDAIAAKQHPSQARFLDKLPVEALERIFFYLAPPLSGIVAYVTPSQAGLPEGVPRWSKRIRASKGKFLCNRLLVIGVNEMKIRRTQALLHLALANKTFLYSVQDWARRNVLSTKSLMCAMERITGLQRDDPSFELIAWSRPPQVQLLSCLWRGCYVCGGKTIRIGEKDKETFCHNKCERKFYSKRGVSTIASPITQHNDPFLAGQLEISSERLSIRAKNAYS